MCAHLWYGKKVDGRRVTAEPFTSDILLIEDIKEHTSYSIILQMQVQRK